MGEFLEKVERRRREEGVEGVTYGAVVADPDDAFLVGLSARRDVSFLISVDRHLLDLPNRAVKDGEGRILAVILRELDRAG